MTSDGEDDWRPSFNTDFSSRRSKTTTKLVGQETGLKGCTFNAFMSCKPKRFDGEYDPLKAISWIREMEAVFHSSKCAEDDKLVYAHTLLKSEAFSWWNSLTNARGINGVIGMSWEEFKLMFMAKFCPKFTIHQLEDEFMRLEQGGMTVWEYTTKFYEKAKFAKFYVSTEEQKLRRYMRGLNSVVRKFVEGENPTTFQSAVNSAEKGEKNIERREEWRQSQKRKGAMENLLGIKFPSSKKLRTAKWAASKKLTPGKGSASKKSTPGKGSVSVVKRCAKCGMVHDGKCNSNSKWAASKKSTPGKGSVSVVKRCAKCGIVHDGECNSNSMPRLCYHCGKDGHKAADCKGERANLCFNCMSPNHLRASCPHLAVQGDDWGGNTNDKKKVTKQNVETGHNHRGKDDHKAADCKVERANLCFHCMSPNHLRASCPLLAVQGNDQGGKSNDKKKVTKQNVETGHNHCGKDGHKAADCKGERVCFHCMSPNHLRASCPLLAVQGDSQGGKSNDKKKVTKQNVETGKRKRDASAGKSKTGSEKKSCQGSAEKPASKGKEKRNLSEMACFRCQEKGHKAADCPKVTNGGTVQVGDRSGTERALHVATHAGQTSTQGGTVQVGDRSGTESALHKATHGAQTSTKGGTVQVGDQSGTERALHMATHPRQTSTQGGTVQVGDRSGTESALHKSTRARRRSGVTAEFFDFRTMTHGTRMSHSRKRKGKV